MGEIEYITSITEKDYPAVIEHLRYNFYVDEPINYSIKLSQPGRPHKFLEQMTTSILKKNLSIVARDKDTQKVVGITLNSLDTPEDVENCTEKLKDPKSEKIHRFLNFLDKKVDIFDKFNVDKVFECKILSVDTNYRGKGIAKELMRRGIQTAKESGYKIFKVGATSFFTQKLAESLGLSAVFEIPFSEYLGEDGKPVFTPDLPHTCVKVFVKIL